MKRVTLVNLNVCSGDGPEAPPLGLLYLASFLNSRGVQVDVRDYTTFEGEVPLSAASLCRFLDGCGDLIGISCMSNMVPFLLSVVGPLKDAFKDRKIVLGGWGPTVEPRLIIDDFPSVDFVIEGWAETALFRLVSWMDGNGSLDAVEGLTFRDEDMVRTVPCGDSTIDIDHLPVPAYHLVDVNRYRRPFSMITSRGCPFKCTFCDISGREPSIVARRSIGLVADELEGLRRFSIHANSSGANAEAENGCQVNQRRQSAPDLVVNIVDDTFFLGKRRVIEFCEEIGRRGISFPWAVSGRVDQVDDELLERMADAGCRGVFLGIESGSNSVLESISKRYTNEEAMRAVDLVINRIGSLYGSLIWGMPMESFDDFKETMALLAFCLSRGATMSIDMWSPLPRSRLYYEHSRELVFSSRSVSGLMADSDEQSILHADVIRKYPGLCSPFYHFPHADLERRRDILRRMGIHA